MSEQRPWSSLCSFACLCARIHTTRFFSLVLPENNDDEEEEKIRMEIGRQGGCARERKEQKNSRRTFSRPAMNILCTHTHAMLLSSGERRSVVLFARSLAPFSSSSVDSRDGDVQDSSSFSLLLHNSEEEEEGEEKKTASHFFVVEGR